MKFEDSKTCKKVLSALKRRTKQGVTARDIINMGFNNPYECIAMIKRNGYEIEAREQKDRKTVKYFLV